MGNRVLYNRCKVRILDLNLEPYTGNLRIQHAYGGDVPVTTRAAAHSEDWSSVPTLHLLAHNPFFQLQDTQHPLYKHYSYLHTHTDTDINI